MRFLLDFMLHKSKSIDLDHFVESNRHSLIFLFKSPTHQFIRKCMHKPNCHLVTASELSFISSNQPSIQEMLAVLPTGNSRRTFRRPRTQHESHLGISLISFLRVTPASRDV
jgi:hypothetical protein